MYWGIFPPRSRDFLVNILPSMNIKNITQTDVMSPDVLSIQTFCPMDVLSHRCYVSGCFAPTDFFSAGHFVPPDILSHQIFSLQMFCPCTLCLWAFCIRIFCLGTPQKWPHNKGKRLPMTGDDPNERKWLRGRFRTFAKRPIMTTHSL